MISVSSNLTAGITYLVIFFFLMIDFFAQLDCNFLKKKKKNMKNFKIKITILKLITYIRFNIIQLDTFFTYLLAKKETSACGTIVRYKIPVNNHKSDFGTVFLVLIGFGFLGGAIAGCSSFFAVENLTQPDLILLPDVESRHYQLPPQQNQIITKEYLHPFIELSYRQKNRLAFSGLYKLRFNPENLHSEEGLNLILKVIKCKKLTNSFFFHPINKPITFQLSTDINGLLKYPDLYLDSYCNTLKDSVEFFFYQCSIGLNLEDYLTVYSRYYFEFYYWSIQIPELSPVFQEIEKYKLELEPFTETLSVYEIFLKTFNVRAKIWVDSETTPQAFVDDIVLSLSKVPEFKVPVDLEESEQVKNILINPYFAYIYAEPFPTKLTDIIAFFKKYISEEI